MEPVRDEAVAQMKRRGVPRHLFPQHAHWDWAAKADLLRLLATCAFAIECDGEWQGAMMTSTAGHFARLDPDRGKPGVYVKYIESAPWNLAQLNPAPRYGAIGTRLIEAAVRLSVDENFRGRVGLHSLPNPDTQSFYERCGMVCLGVDPDVEHLPYYEMTRERATLFLTGGNL
ncbi:MAG: hypothetical protein ACREHD_21065 [Pirellulales bacterium]